MIAGLSDRARPREEALRPPRSLGSVLRGIARDRGVVRLETRAGRLTGRIAAVGADALDVDQLPTGERSSSVTGAARLTVAMSALLAIRQIGRASCRVGGCISVSRARLQRTGRAN